MTAKKPNARHNTLPHPPEVRAKCIAELKSGKRLYLVARENKIDKTTLRRWLTRDAQGLTPTPPPPTRRTGRMTRYTPEQKAQAVAELDAGVDANELAARHGITSSGLYYWRKRIRAEAVAGVGAGGRIPRIGSHAVVVAAPKNGHVVAVASDAIRDATVFLRQAKRELISGIKSDRIKDLDQAHLLALMALNSLQGNG